MEISTQTNDNINNDENEIQIQESWHTLKKLDYTNPSPFDTDEWKRCYSNCHRNYADAMTTFWEKVDLDGWSLWRGDYNYNDELRISFMVRNLVNGFIQSTEDIRKWLFGVISIRGNEDTKMFKISVFFLIRGHSINPLIECNDGANYYTWTKLDKSSADYETNQDLLNKYWSIEDNVSIIEGENVIYSKCYK